MMEQIYVTVRMIVAVIAIYLFYRLDKEEQRRRMIYKKEQDDERNAIRKKKVDTWEVRAVIAYILEILLLVCGTPGKLLVTNMMVFTFGSCAVIHIEEYKIHLFFIIVLGGTLAITRTFLVQLGIL